MKNKKELDKIIAAINSKYGEGTVSVGKNVSLDIERIRSGVVALDLVIGGGIPRGGIIELYGREAGGKTSTALKIVTAYQKQGLTCAYIDIEHAFDPAWARILGVDTDTLLLSQPDTLEKSTDIVDALVQSNEVDLIIYDSVAAAVPQEEAEGSASDQQMALRARHFAKMCRKIISSLQPDNLEDEKTHNKTTLILINQVIDKIGNIYARGYETPGGHAIKHACKIIVELKCGERIINKVTKDIEGIEIKFITKKNKTWIPYKSGMYKLFVDGSVDNDETIIAEAIKHGLIKQAGPMYTYKDFKEKGKVNLINTLKEKRLLKKLTEEMYKIILKRDSNDSAS
jgi:recombination protein RecA